MYQTYYNYTKGEMVWIECAYDALECVVHRVLLEVDPDETEGQVERNTYYLMSCCDNTVFVRDESLVFVSLDDALDYIDNPEYIAPRTENHTFAYTYTLGQTVWTYNVHEPVEATILQISININDEEELLYHLLPEDDSFGSMMVVEKDIFPTYEKAMEYITAVVLEVTLTPTITPTQTVTPNPTVTPTMTVTPTPSPAPLSRFELAVEYLNPGPWGMWGYSTLTKVGAIIPSIYELDANGIVEISSFAITLGLPTDEYAIYVTFDHTNGVAETLPEIYIMIDNIRYTLMLDTEVSTSDVSAYSFNNPPLQETIDYMENNVDNTVNVYMG